MDLSTVDQSSETDNEQNSNGNPSDIGLQNDTGSQDKKNKFETHGKLGMHIAILAIGAILVIAGMLGTTMYNTMETATSVENGKTAESINSTFIAWIIVGVLFLFLFSMVWVEEAAFEKCKENCLTEKSTIQVNSKMAILKRLKISVVTIIYIISAILITTCAEGIALYGMIKTYASPSNTQAERDANKSLATNIYNTFIGFLVVVCFFIIIYTGYIFNAHVKIYDSIKSR